MPTVWGTLELVHRDGVGAYWLQMRAILSEGVRIRIRVLIEQQTTVVRGIERVDLLSLKEGESVEVTYHCGCKDLLEAETVYVRPDEVVVSQR